EPEVEPAIGPLNPLLHCAQNADITGCRMCLHFGDRPVVLGRTARRGVDQVASANGHQPGDQGPAQPGAHANHSGASDFRAASVSAGSLPGTEIASATSLTPVRSSSAR